MVGTTIWREDLTRRRFMEGGLIWLASIGSIVVLAAILVGIAFALRRRRRSMQRSNRRP